MLTRTAEEKRMLSLNAIGGRGGVGGWSHRPRAVRFCLQLEASGPSKRIEVATLLEFVEEIIVFMSWCHAVG